MRALALVFGLPPVGNRLYTIRHQHSRQSSRYTACMAKLRSAEWWSKSDYYSFARRAWLRSEGFSGEIFDDKPIIGICNSWSELNNCNAHLRTVAEAVKRGVWAAGGVPLEFPTISLGEMFMKPTAMLFRNLMAMDVEESIRGNPIDGVVLLCGCDKTTPAQLMGAASADLPAIVVTGGPMLSGQWKMRKLGSGTDGRKLFDMFRTGRLTPEEWCEVEAGLARSPGHCTVMGTASTMACVAEALGMTLPGCAAIPAVDSRRLLIAEQSGARAVSMVREGLTPSRILTSDALENAITACMALGGSTNAVIHLLALAGRLGLPLDLDAFDRISRHTPYLANIKPSGEYLMEEFFAAGGMGALLREILPLLHAGALTANGRSLGDNIADAPCHDRDVVRTCQQPLQPEGGIAVLRGNLAPRGALIKQSAASPHLLSHSGPAHVFNSYDEMLAGVDDPNLPVTPDSVLVLKNAGPKGGPGMPEWGHIPMPKALLQQGVNDVVRISDARMSGTSFGTVVLHITPEAAVGGPLAIVETGDRITLSVEQRRIDVELAPAAFSQRMSQLVARPNSFTRGYGRLYWEHVNQADEGCDFDFLKKNPA
jgi:L-arabonate dehydrase